MDPCIEEAAQAATESSSFAAAAIAAQLQGDTEKVRRLIKTLEAAAQAPRRVRNLVDDTADEPI